MEGIKVYGADWSQETQHTRQHLQQLGVEFIYVNVDHDQQAKHWVRVHNDGQQKLPTVDIAGRVLSVPTDRELDRVLKEKGVLN